MNGRVLTFLLVSFSALPLAEQLRSGEKDSVTTVRVRYMVNDLAPAVEFCTKYLGVQGEQQGRPNFAMLSRGSLELVLSTPPVPGGAAKPRPDRRKPERSGWNRIIINVDDLAGEVGRLRNLAG